MGMFRYTFVTRKPFYRIIPFYRTTVYLSAVRLSRQRDRLRLWDWILIVFGIAAPSGACGDTDGSLPALLPAGFLHVRGSHIVGPDGTGRR
jgi:hypothetical protein